MGHPLLTPGSGSPHLGNPCPRSLQRWHQLPQDGFATSDSRELLYYSTFPIFLMKAEALEKDGKALP